MNDKLYKSLRPKIKVHITPIKKYPLLKITYQFYHFTQSLNSLTANFKMCEVYRGKTGI